MTSDGGHYDWTGHLCPETGRTYYYSSSRGKSLWHSEWMKLHAGKENEGDFTPLPLHLALKRHGHAPGGANFDHWDAAVLGAMRSDGQEGGGGGTTAATVVLGDGGTLTAAPPADAAQGGWKLGTHSMADDTWEERVELSTADHHIFFYNKSHGTSIWARDVQRLSLRAWHEDDWMKEHTHLGKPMYHSASRRESRHHPPGSYGKQPIAHEWSREVDDLVSEIKDNEVLGKCMGRWALPKLIHIFIVKEMPFRRVAEISRHFKPGLLAGIFTHPMTPPALITHCVKHWDAASVANGLHDMPHALVEKLLRSKPPLEISHVFTHWTKAQIMPVLSLMGEERATEIREHMQDRSHEDVWFEELCGAVEAQMALHRREAFKALVVHGDASIDDSSVWEVLRAVGVSLETPTIKRCIEQSRNRKTGRVEFYIFEELYKLEIAALKAFAEFDKDGSGTIDAHECHAVLQRMGQDHYPKLVERFLRHHGVGKKQEISWHGFEHLYRNICRKVVDEEANWELFREADKENSGSIELSECLVSARKRYGKDFKRVDCYRIIQLSETEKGGLVNFDEFEMIMHNIALYRRGLIGFDSSGKAQIHRSKDGFTELDNEHLEKMKQTSGRRLLTTKKGKLQRMESTRSMMSYASSVGRRAASPGSDGASTASASSSGDSDEFDSESENSDDFVDDDSDDVTASVISRLTADSETTDYSRVR